MRKQKMNRKWLTAPMALIAVGTTAGVLFAQPDAGDAPKGDNPPNMQGGGRGGRGGQAGQNNRPDFRNMTPEQRQQFQQQRQQEMQERRAEGLRRTLNDAGFTNTVVQDAIVEFANAQDKERNASDDKVRQLAQAIRGGASDNDIAALLTAVRSDAANAKARRAASLRALDAKIGYTKSPKLEALLALSGLTGEELAPGGGRGGFGGPGMMGGRGGPGMMGRQDRQGGQGRQGGGFGGGPVGPNDRAQGDDRRNDMPNA